MPGVNDTVTIAPALSTTVTVDDVEFAAGLTLAANNTLQIVNNPNSLTPSSLTATVLTISGAVNDFGLIQVNSNVTDPTLIFEGHVTVQGGGEIEATGCAALVEFIGDTVINLNLGFDHRRSSRDGDVLPRLGRQCRHDDRDVRRHDDVFYRRFDEPRNDHGGLRRRHDRQHPADQQQPDPGGGVTGVVTL